MKREFLKGFNLADDVIEQIMTEHGKSITAAKGDADAQKQQLAARDMEIEGLKSQLAQRDIDIKALMEGAANADDLKTQLDTLQDKYRTDTEALNQKLQDQLTEFETARATEKFFSGVQFSSGMAKEAAIARFRAKGLKLDGETFQGGTEWLETFRKENPDAFTEEEPKGDPPSFTRSLNPKGTDGGKTPPPRIF